MGPTASVPPGLRAGMMVGGKYELLRKIGRGAMGEVWAARHATIGQEVALKLVVRDVDNGDGSSSESRFLVEARVAAALSRKTRHIVAVTDHGQDGQLGYLVMELLEGEGLDARIERTGARPLADVAPMIMQVARGLTIAHADGVTHRDLKPSNIFVTKDEDGGDLAKVLDFGIAKLRRGSTAFSTQRGFLLGTPAYMSPEQALGKSIDHRTDVWALGVIAYHMLTNEFPFDADSADELFGRIIRVQPVPILDRRPELPPVVGDFFSRVFAMRLEDRFQSAMSLANAFAQLEALAARGERELPPPMPAIGDDEFDSMGTSYGAGGGAQKGGEGSSIIGAGVPRRSRYAIPMIGGLLVGMVVALTCVTLSVYYEREPRPAHATVAPVVPAAAAAPVMPALEAPPPVVDEEQEPVTASVPVVTKQHRRSPPRVMRRAPRHVRPVTKRDFLA